MPTKNEAAPPQERRADLAQRVREATELLEAIVDDRGLLAGLDAEDRRRILDAAGNVYNPDVSARRRMVKATIRARKSERVRQDDARLERTGIRKLRRQTVFTTPDPVLPAEFSPGDETVRPSEGESQNCYI